MHDQTSDRLAALSPKIMDLWMVRTLEEVKAANLQETLALRNSLPIYLSQLVDALSNTIDRTDARKIYDLNNSTRIGKKHGRERATASEYTMDQMILEYHILRQVICDVMESEAPLTAVEREVIVCSIEQAVNDAATQFSDTLREFQNFLSHTLAHDLRTPLTTVKATAQVLQKQLSEDGQQSKITRIIQSVNRIDDMIRQLLDEGRISAVKDQPMTFTEMDLDWLIRDIAYELNISNPDRFVIISGGECFGFWNQNCLRRLIENLASNAIKYGAENGLVTLTLSQDEKTVTLKVHNTGNPIPEEQHEKLFEKFSRLGSSNKKIGWGIGLAVVRSMIEQHHGTISVRSSVAEGTTFNVTLPKDSSN